MSASSCKTMAVYDQDLCDEMECLVCTEYMHPPIKQCTTGHSFCHNCFKRMDKCPKCRISLAETVRNFTLENIYSRMMFPCRNLDVGCKEIDVGGKIRDHEIICGFTIVRCRISCNWSGPLNHLVNHCKELHAENIFFKERQGFVCPNFLRIADSTHYFFLFFVHEKLFLCAWDANFETGLVRWCVFLMNKGEDCVDFEFQIEIRKHADEAQRLCLRGPCPVLGPETGDGIFNNQQFTFSHCDMIEDYCDGDDLIYTVEIFKYEDPE